ncbi:MAG: hypothetical protein EOP04_29370 [Proteobacteria bacterium]|nr:MAG: hypothetical protein EOP04_29370 [Pseudomonadota bacterium]
MKQSREVDLLFYFDGFQPAQEEVLRNSLNLAFQAYNDYFSNNEPLKQCVKKYTTKDWIPYGGLGKSLATVDQQIAWAMTSTWFNFAWHADTSTVIVINSAYIPSDGSSYTMGRVETIGTDAIANVSSSTYNDVNMNIFINTVAIDSGHYNAHDFAGTIYHEFMHRKGFTHNSGYRGALIKELGLCIARENADESLSLTWKPEMVD